jgi:AGZA family xanthine/uracil permease-like MFS transporter
MPAIAAWGLSLVSRYISTTGNYSTEEVGQMIAKAMPDLKGILSFSEGPLLSAMFLTAVTVYLIEKNFLKAFLWTIPLIICSFFGFIHSRKIGVFMAGEITFGYILFSAILLAVYFYSKYAKDEKK